MINVLASSSHTAANDKGEKKNDYEQEDDEDSPSNCVFTVLPSAVTETLCSVFKELNKMLVSFLDAKMEPPGLSVSRRACASCDNNNGQDFWASNPSYVEYNGTYYQISEFSSILQGKLQLPSTSRNA